MVQSILILKDVSELVIEMKKKKRVCGIHERCQRADQLFSLTKDQTGAPIEHAVMHIAGIIKFDKYSIANYDEIDLSIVGQFDH